jgi:SAM-dependent methyltransferase
MYLKHYAKRIVKDILIQFPKRVLRFFEYLGEFFRFRNMNKKRSKVRFRDAYPCLKDKIQNTPFDHHYTYHPAWAARVLAKTRPDLHIDISSILSFNVVLSAFIPVKFYDYRPADLQLSNLESGFADLKQLPFTENSIHSLSCMHTIEHIGLGRYGDELDAYGDIKAINELKRVLKPGGDLLFVTPVGIPKIEFNGHRIYSFEQIMEYFSPLTLTNFSMVPDQGGFIENADPSLVSQQTYGCGCFWFKKQIPINN